MDGASSVRCHYGIRGPELATHLHHGDGVTNRSRLGMQSSTSDRKMIMIVL